VDGFWPPVKLQKAKQKFVEILIDAPSLVFYYPLNTGKEVIANI
jgi:hypothetical protein